MSSLSIAREPRVRRVVPSRVDNEAAAGGDDARPRVARPTLMYRGQDEPHWQGQPCYVPDPQSVTATGVHVVFACGCRALVAVTCLEATR